MWKKILTMSLVLVIVLSFTACGEETKEELELPSAQEIVDGVIHSMDEIRTYQYDIDATWESTTEREGEAFIRTFSQSYSWTLDIENRQGRVDITLESMPKTEPDITGGVEIYIIEGMAYSKMTTPGEEPTWEKEKAPDDWLEKWQQSGQMGMVFYSDCIEVLEAAQVEVIGSEMIGGIDCYVLEVTPDFQQLWKLFSHQLFQEPSDVTEEYIQEVIRSFSVKHWIAKDTYFLMKAEIDIAVELTPETSGPSAMEQAMVLLAYNYNQPVYIVLPPEAEEAIEVPME
jgi:predicted small lipoprotein YifL